MGFLAAARERLLPEPEDIVAEGAQRLAVVGHCVVVVVPLQDAGEPDPLLWDGQMSPPAQLALEGVQLGGHPFRVGDPLQLETTLPRLRTDVREPEEGKPAPRGAMRKMSYAGCDPGTAREASAVKVAGPSCRTA